MNGESLPPDTLPAQARKSLYSGPRGTAVKILNRVERTDSYLDKVLDIELKSPDLSDVDKGLLTELVHGVLRWQNRLDWVLNGFSHGNFSKSEINIKNTLRVALYQVLFLDRIPHAAAVNEGVEFIKRIRGEKPAGLVNAVLRNIIRNIEGIRYPPAEEDQVQYLAVYYSHPQWMVKRWAARFGIEETKKLLIANNERPSLALRINKLKIEPGMFLRQLEQQEIEYTGSSHVDYFVRVKGLARIGQMELFRNGMFTVQDESAALPCLLLSPKPGERVIDLCAAPGGKTTNIAEIMKNEGEVIAVDKYEAKLSLIRASCERLGLRNVSLRAADATMLEAEAADKVLLDVPCSGLGVLMKKPDIKWKRDVSDILKLTRIQTSLMENAAPLVKPGGALVYCTCTMEPEENQQIVRTFLERHPEFALENAQAYVSHDLVNAEGFVETYPHRHDMDGSFAARLVKRGNTQA
ncbi:MAG TPA: 16S rRNA (cytosine(967)-C(5))-methyltransferase RsmB [Bacteroidota bacterium]|nr:16S rRNA (cytosine(967)-C(5))-methyltransferase RsmB [Bacteroidota bacterium]